MSDFFFFMYTAPYYGSVAISPQPPEDYTLSQDSDQEAPPVCRPTDQLYQRIQALSDQIHSELDTLIDIESVSSQQQTPIPVDVDSMRESLQELSALRDSPPTPDECTSVTSNTDTNECRDLVCISDSEMAKDLDCGSTDSATPAPRPSSDQSIVHSDPKLKKAFDKMKKLDEKLADLEKVRGIKYRLPYMYLHSKDTAHAYSCRKRKRLRDSGSFLSSRWRTRVEKVFL